MYGGMSRGELNIFAGGSGSGKSLVMMNIALNWLSQGLSGVYITLELSEELTSLRKEAKGLVAKWKKTGLLEGISNETERTNMAQLLENQAKQLVVESSQLAKDLTSLQVELVKTGLGSHYH